MTDRKERVSDENLRKAVCACSLVAPCSGKCTCRWPWLSGGCQRCATYGSRDQQMESASRIETSERELQDSRERVRELEDAILDGPKWHAFPCTYCVPSRMWTENGEWQVEHAPDCITVDIRRRKENA